MDASGIEDINKILREFHLSWMTTLEELAKGIQEIFEQLYGVVEESKKLLSSGPDPLFIKQLRPCSFVPRYNYRPPAKRNEPYMRRDNYYGRS